MNDLNNMNYLIEDDPLVNYLKSTIGFSDFPQSVLENFIDSNLLSFMNLPLIMELDFTLNGSIEISVAVNKIKKLLIEFFDGEKDLDGRLDDGFKFMVESILLMVKLTGNENFSEMPLVWHLELHGDKFNEILNKYKPSINENS